MRENSGLVALNVDEWDTILDIFGINVSKGGGASRAMATLLKLKEGARMYFFFYIFICFLDIFVFIFYF